jgi:hypothetical protein
MATGKSNLYDIPYPILDDTVNVHGDIKDLVDRLEIVLPPLGVSYFQLPVTNIGSEDLPAGTPVYATGYTTKTTVAKATPETTGPILGLLKQTIAQGTDGIVVVAGVLDGINTSAFSDGDVLYVGVSGGLSATQNGGAVGIVALAASSGIIIVEAKGNGTWGALKAGLA